MCRIFVILFREHNLLCAMLCVDTSYISKRVHFRSLPHLATSIKLNFIFLKDVVMDAGLVQTPLRKKLSPSKLYRCRPSSFRIFSDKFTAVIPVMKVTNYYAVMITGQLYRLINLHAFYFWLQTGLK